MVVAGDNDPVRTMVSVMMTREGGVKWNCCVFVWWFCCWGDETNHVCWFMLSFFFLSLGWGRGASPRDYHRRWSAPGCAAMSLRPLVINFNFSNVVVASVVVVVLGKKKLRLRWKIIEPHTATGAHRVRVKERERGLSQDAVLGYCCKALVTQHVHRKCRSN